jgi:hypothetical protein
MEIPIITPEVYSHYSPDGVFLGDLNYYEHLYLCLKIAQKRLSNFYLMNEGHKVFINKRGQVTTPGKVYQQIPELLSKIAMA